VSRVVVVIEYEVGAAAGGPLGRIGQALLERAVHDPIEGAAHLVTMAMVGGDADAVMEAIGARVAHNARAAGIPPAGRWAP
jgi:hypothetical protein